jgi:hypothetical protein
MQGWWRPSQKSSGGSQAESDGSEAVVAKKPGFREIAPEAGLDFHMTFLPGEQGETFKINLYDHGCGVAVGDYDSDGRDDIYFTNQVGGNALFRNLGDGKFADVTASMGVALDDRICVAATFADYDNDGDQDLFVTSTRGGNVLFRNEEGMRFTDVTQEAGVAHVGHSQAGVFFDYDRDGLLDLYLMQTANWTTEDYDDEIGYFVGKEGVFGSPKEYNILYRNAGGGKFVDVTEKAGLRGGGWSSDAAVWDYDEDGWLDVFVVCMFGRSQLYRNRQDGSFEDVTADVFGRTPCGGVGVKLLDVDADGLLDVYVVDMHSDMWMGLDKGHTFRLTSIQAESVRFDHFFGPRVQDSAEFRAQETALLDQLEIHPAAVLFGNACYRALGGGKFEEVSAKMNLENFWPWGIGAGDFNNDGLEDMLITSGMGYPFWHWPNQLLMNEGRGRFAKRSLERGVEPPRGGIYLDETIGGERCPKSSRGAATGDFDGDGGLEVVTNNFNDRPYFFQNEFPRGNYVALRLRGTKSNRDAIGAVARLTAGGKTFVRQVQTANGYLSQSSKTLHFGLGDIESIYRIDIEWPGGARQTLKTPAINKLHDVTEP